MGRSGSLLGAPAVGHGKIGNSRAARGRSAAVRAAAVSIALAFSGSVGFCGIAAAASPLVDLAGDNDRVSVTKLLSEGADPNATSDDGTTALHWAAYYDDVDLARQLVAAGATSS